ncbi:hypothetical protein HAX54_019399, partial [Datura stramonium]|nr:hypothetical protein [Datura stramonium]
QFDNEEEEERGKEIVRRKSVAADWVIFRPIMAENNGGTGEGENEGEERKLVALWWLVGFEFMVVFIVLMEDERGGREEEKRRLGRLVKVIRV